MIILGLVILSIGVVLVIKTEWFLQNFGRITWFENTFGTEGGSRLGYKLLGLLAIFIGIVMISGNGLNFFTWLLSPLIPKS